MAILTGNNGKILIGGTQLFNIKTMSIDIKADTIETTTMGVDSRTYVKGLSSYSGSADVYVDVANLTGGASAIAALIATGGNVGDGTSTFEADLDIVGAPSGKKFTGNIIVTGFAVKSGMDSLVEATVSFQGSGAITFTA